MSLANVLGCARASSSLVLLGDPQQLEQPTKGSHPDGVGVSALQHVLGDAVTMPPEKGLFLPVTNDGAKAESFWADPIVTKYKSQVETMIANSQNGKLFGFTTGKVFPSIGAISGQNVIAETRLCVRCGRWPTLCPSSHAMNWSPHPKTP